MVQISCDLSIPTKPSKGNENGRQMSKVFTVSYPTAIIPRHFCTSQVSQINQNSSVCFKSLEVWTTIKLRRKTTLLGWCLLNTLSKRSRTSWMLSLSLVLITFIFFLILLQNMSINLNLALLGQKKMWGGVLYTLHSFQVTMYNTFIFFPNFEGYLWNFALWLYNASPI